MCKVESRTVGAYAHVTAVFYVRHEESVWYLSFKLLRIIQNAAMDIDKEDIIEPNPCPSVIIAVYIIISPF